MVKNYRKMGRMQRGGGGEFKWEGRFCDILPKNALKDNNFDKNSFIL